MKPKFDVKTLLENLNIFNPHIFISETILIQNRKVIERKTRTFLNNFHVRKPCVKKNTNF